MKTVLVLCGGNSCRSQMAEGYLTHFAGAKAKVYSAGVEAHGVNPNSIKVMAEDGIDISRQTSNKMDDYRNINFDIVLTVCDNSVEECPFFPTRAKKFHHSFPDPAKCKGSEAEVLNEFRKVRDLVKAYCQQFAKDNL